MLERYELQKKSDDIVIYGIGKCLMYIFVDELNLHLFHDGILYFKILKNICSILNLVLALATFLYYVFD